MEKVESPRPTTLPSQLLADLYAVWECCDQAWGHTGMKVQLSADGEEAIRDEDVHTMCLQGATERMAASWIKTESAIERHAGTWALGRWSESSTKPEVMRAIGKAIATEEARCLSRKS